MSSVISNEIKCIIRFDELIRVPDSIRGFLIDEKIVNKEIYVGLLTRQEIAEATLIAIKKALKSEMISLIDFEWNVLPKEQIRVTIVTHNNSKEFTFGF